MDKELIKAIESRSSIRNGSHKMSAYNDPEHSLTLHGDIEFFAHLVAEREREACAKLVMDNYHMFQTVEAAKSLANGILKREHG